MATEMEERLETEEAHGYSHLPRRLGLLSAIAILIGSTIGTGIFRTPAGIATKVPFEGIYLLLWTLGGFFSLCGALTLAELAGALPRTGGIFVFLREGWGRLPAFLFGWGEFVVIRASALGAISTVFAEYFLRVIGKSDAQLTHYVAAGAVLLVALYNIAGVRFGALVQNLTTGTKYGALLLLVAAAFIIGGQNPAKQTALEPIAPEQASATGPALTKKDVLNLLAGGMNAERVTSLVAARGANFKLTGLVESEIKAAGGDQPLLDAINRSTPATLMLFGLAFVSLLWVFDGWADVTFIGGEVRRPERFLPIALITGTCAVIAIYLLANLAYLHLLSIHQIADSKLVAADTAFRILGNTGERLVSIAVMISAFGTLNGSMMTGPRIFFAMADEGLFFKKIAQVHRRFKTPYLAIGLAATLAIIFVLVRTFEQLSDTFVLGIWPFYALGVAAVYRLRRKRPDLRRPYRTFGYPVTPALFILAVSLLIGNALLSDIRYYIGRFAGWPNAGEGSGAVMVALIILAGIPAYYLWTRVTRSEPKN
jgi:amino acid transporter